MKKVCFLLVLTITTIVSFSQQGRKVKWGIQVGANIANVTYKINNISFSPSSIVGLNEGVSAEIPFAPGFFVQPEFNLSQLGTKIDVPFSSAGQIFPNSTDSSSITAKTVLNYLTLPVLIKFKAPRTGLGIYVGPQFSYLASARDTYKNDTQSLKVNSKDGDKSFDFSAVLGAEYFLPAGLGLSVRYQLGFTNIDKESGGVGTVKNHAFTFTIGYRF